MSRSSPLPPMAEVSRHKQPQEDNSNVSISQPYSRPPIHHPPRAYVPHHSPRHSQNWSNGYQRHPRNPGSISSDTTASSSQPAQKKSPHLTAGRPYLLSSHTERGLMEDRQSSRGGYAGSNPRAGHPQATSITGQSTTENNSTVYRYIQGQVEEEGENDHAIWVLLWLSFLDPFMSMFCAIFTIVSVAVLFLVSPIRICRPPCSITTSIIRTVAPLFRSHLRLMYAPSVEDVHTFDFKTAVLILTQLSSPVLSIGVAVAAWIAAAFWLFALMMGNPDGTERRDDGRAAVLGVRNWWEKFFLYAIR